jgi:peptide deformylase
MAMTLRSIILHPDPRLKKPCDPVARITPEIETLAADMLATMYDAPGVGLAAPQVGVLSRLNTYEEGCLSIPDHYADVTRPAEVRVRWLGLDGKTHERDFEGLWATCAQHEIDHLDGRLFIDYLSPIKRQMITRKMVKLKRERGRA